MGLFIAEIRLLVVLPHVPPYLMDEKLGVGGRVGSMNLWENGNRLITSIWDKFRFSIKSVQNLCYKKSTIFSLIL